MPLLSALFSALRSAADGEGGWGCGCVSEVPSVGAFCGSGSPPPRSIEVEGRYGDGSLVVCGFSIVLLVSAIGLFADGDSRTAFVSYIQ
jgi:hypothetical protein